MDSNALTALAGLTGAVLGGATSVLTSWLAQRVQTSTQWRRREQERREDLYNAFIETAVECYADALQHDGPDVPSMVTLYAKVDQMYLRSSRRVIDSAEEICRIILQTFGDPNKELHELRAGLADGSIRLLAQFSEACRTELDEIGAGRI